MAVRIRLARKGRKKKPFYHIVVADARAPRDGKYIDRIGSYNPLTVPATIEVDRDKAFQWLEKGAQPSDTAKAILKFKGVYYRRHLARGVAKGALTAEQAESMHQEWIAAKESKIEARREQTRIEKENFWKQVSGEIKPKAAKKVDEATQAAFAATEGAADAPAAEGDAPAVEAPAAEAPVVEAEAAAPEAPAAVAEVVAEAEAPAPVAEAEAPAPEAPAVEAEATKAEAPAAEEKPASSEEE